MTSEVSQEQVSWTSVNAWPLENKIQEEYREEIDSINCRVRCCCLAIFLALSCVFFSVVFNIPQLKGVAKFFHVNPKEES